jgi:hypothetical protein
MSLGEMTAIDGNLSGDRDCRRYQRAMDRCFLCPATIPQRACQGWTQRPSGNAGRLAVKASKDIGLAGNCRQRRCVDCVVITGRRAAKQQACQRRCRRKRFYRLARQHHKNIADGKENGLGIRDRMVHREDDGRPVCLVDQRRPRQRRLTKVQARCHLPCQFRFPGRCVAFDDAQRNRRARDVVKPQTGILIPGNLAGKIGMAPLNFVEGHAPPIEGGWAGDFGHKRDVDRMVLINQPPEHLIGPKKTRFDDVVHD